MQSNNQKYLKGLGIATLVLSILTLVGIVLACAFMALGQGFLNANAADIFSDAYYSTSTHGMDHHYSLSPTETMDMINILWGIIYLVAAWEAVAAIVTLVAGVLAMRHFAVYEKYGAIMGWGIAGAIAAFLSGRIITTVLLILVAVFANKAKNEANAYAAAYGVGAQAVPGGYGAYAAGQQGFGYGTQGFGAAPAQNAAYQQAYAAPTAQTGVGGYPSGVPQAAQPYAAPTAQAQSIPVNEAYARSYGAEVGGPAPTSEPAQTATAQPEAGQAAAAQPAVTQPEAGQAAAAPAADAQEAAAQPEASDPDGAPRP